MDELRAKVEQELNKGFYNVNTSSLAQLYQAVFFETFDIDCNKCKYPAYLKLKKWLRGELEETKTTTNMEAKLKQRIKLEILPEGATTRIKGWPSPITQKTTTQGLIDWIKKEGKENMLEDIPATEKVAEKNASSK